MKNINNVNKKKSYWKWGVKFLVFDTRLAFLKVFCFVKMQEIFFCFHVKSQQH